jgi:hypothetical protein
MLPAAVGAGDAPGPISTSTYPTEVGGDGRETLAPPQPNFVLDMNRQVAIDKPTNPRRRAHSAGRPATPIATLAVPRRKGRPKLSFMMTATSVAVAAPRPRRSVSALRCNFSGGRITREPPPSRMGALFCQGRKLLPRWARIGTTFVKRSG